MTDAKSADAKSTTPTPAVLEPAGPAPVVLEPAGPERAESASAKAAPGPTGAEAVIPGWRLILSDTGRLWASREEPFSPVAFHAGAERTVDADTLDALHAETDRQEAIAVEARQQEESQRAAGQVTP